MKTPTSSEFGEMSAAGGSSPGARQGAPHAEPRAGRPHDPDPTDPGEVSSDEKVVHSRPPKRTLPPPEWSGPRSVSLVALDRFDHEQPLSRQYGRPAALATLRAKIKSAIAAGDWQTEARYSGEMAQQLAIRGTELDEALRLARRALLFGETGSLRWQMAGWYSTLGKPELAAATLMPLAERSRGDRAAQLWARIAVLRGRIGDFEGAGRALDRAIEKAPEHVTLWELRGTLLGSRPGTRAVAWAAEGYLKASQLKARAGDGRGALESALRAFELSPCWDPVGAYLVELLVERECHALADQVLVRCALETADRSVLHERRMRLAVGVNHWPRALAAAFANDGDVRLSARDLNDARQVLLEHEAADFDPDRSEREAPLPTLRHGFDTMLVRAKCFAWLMARFDLAAVRWPEARSTLLDQAARLALSHLQQPDIAADLWMRAAIEDPAAPEAWRALAEHFQRSGNASWWTEAHVRVALELTRSSHDQPWTAAALQRVKNLVEIARVQLADPALALWALQVQNQFDASAANEDQRLEELGEQVTLQQTALSEVRQRLCSLEGEARREWLTQLAGVLAGRPDDAGEYASVLRELCDLVPDDGYARTLDLVLERLGRSRELEVLRQNQIQKASSAVRAEFFAWKRVRELAAKKQPRLALAMCQELIDDAESRFRVDGASDGAGEILASYAVCLAGAVNDRRARARAAQRLAVRQTGSLRAELASSASWQLYALGETLEAREAALDGSRAGPQFIAPILALSNYLWGERDALARMVWQRAITIGIPARRVFEELTEALFEAGDVRKAVRYSRRWLALCPGDVQARRQLLRFVTAGGDATQIVDVVRWMVEQPHELAHELPALLRALDAVSEHTAEAAKVAQYLLDAFGAGTADLAERVSDLARRSQQTGLLITCLERALAGQTDPDPSRLVELSKIRASVGDGDGSARAAVRALDAGADPASVSAVLDSELQVAAGGDGKLSLLEARARTFEALGQREEAAKCLRRLGATFWDVAGDRDGALAVWRKAAQLRGTVGVEQMARDLIAFAGVGVARDILAELASGTKEPQAAASWLAVAAAMALKHGAPSDALSMAINVLQLNSKRTDALAIAEASARADDVAELDEAYRLAETGVVGRFGERTLHFRAARQFESRGQPKRALDHGLSAFAALPTEGSLLATLVRLAHRTGDMPRVVAALRAEGDRAGQSGRRTGWLERASALARLENLALRDQLEIYLPILLSQPSSENFAAFASLCRQAQQEVPSEREWFQLRFERAAMEVLERVTTAGSLGLFLQLASSALELNCRGVALSALTRAREIDARAGCESFIAHAGKLAQAEREAGQFVEACASAIADASNDSVPVTPTYCELASLLAERLGQPERAAQLAVAAARGRPDEYRLVERALGLADALDRPELVEQVRQSQTPDERLKSLLGEARRSFEAGDAGAALGFLEQAVRTEQASETLRIRAGRQLVEGLRAWDIRRLPDKLQMLLGLPSLGGRAFVVDFSVELVRVLIDLGRAEDAKSQLKRLAPEGRFDPPLAKIGLELARRLADPAVECAWLEHVVEQGAAPELRVHFANLLHRIGETPRAVAALEELVSEEPSEARAWDQLLGWAKEAKLYDVLASALKRRARVAGSEDDRVEWLLESADVYERKLDDPRTAETIFENLSHQYPERLEVSLARARRAERCGEMREAAQAWLVSADASRAGERESCLARAVGCFIQVEDHERALRTLNQIQDLNESEPLCELAVRVERQRGNPRDLAAALERLARVSTAAPHHRAGLLMNAAEEAREADLPYAVELAAQAAELAADDESTKASADELLIGLETALLPPSAPEPARQSRSTDIGAPSGQPLPLEAALASEALLNSDTELSEELWSVSSEFEHPIVSTASPGLPTPPPPTVADVDVWRQGFANGDLQAGRYLMNWLSRDTGKRQERVEVCSELAQAEPGDLAVLRELSRAAGADNDEVYASAVGHAAESFDPFGQPTPAPPLSAQPIEPERVRGLLRLQERGWPTRIAEVLVESAADLLRVEPGHRQPASVAINTFVEELAPRLGVPKLKVSSDLRKYNALAGEFLPLDTDAAVLGDARARLEAGDTPVLVVHGAAAGLTPALRFEIGAALIGHGSSLVVLQSLAPARLKSLIQTVWFAFGPAGLSGGVPSEQAHEAARLWESIPPAGQRVLREACAGASLEELDGALEAAQSPLRAAGLYASGDLRQALTATFAARGKTQTELYDLLQEAEAAAQLCRSDAAVRELAGLAVRPEFAYARWQTRT